MPFNFPTNPALNQLYEYGEKGWVFNGTGWTQLVDKLLPRTATVGNALIWNGTAWTAADPLLVGDSTFGTYQLVMDANTTGPQLEAHVSTLGGFLGFTLLLVHPTRWSEVAGNTTALATIVASATAFNAMLSSAAAMGAVVGLPATMAFIAASSAAMSGLVANGTALSVTLASTTGRAAVLSSTAAMTIVASSVTAMGAITSSATYMQALASSLTALTVVVANATALATFRASTALTAVAIPIMTGATSPSGQVAVSTTNGGESYKAMDKNTATTWVTAFESNYNQWLSYDFGSAVYIHEAILTASGYSETPKNFAVEYSDNNLTWFSAVAATHPQSAAPVSYKVLAAGKHRYWRLFVGDNYGSYYSIVVIEFNLVGFTW